MYAHIHIYIYIHILQAQELRELLKVLKPLQMAQLHLPGFQDFALPKHLIKKTGFPLVWMFACEKLWRINSGHADTHTQTYLHCLKSIDFLEIDPRVYLSNLHYWVIHMEDIHWFPNLIISKGNNEAKAPKQQQVLASYIQYVSICIVLAIHVYVYIYNGYKNLSTYLSYTAGFLQAQKLSKLLKRLQMVQLLLPRFQDFASSTW